MDEKTEDLLIKVGIGVAVVLFVVKPLKDILTGDNADKDYINSLPPDQNPFNVKYLGEGVTDIPEYYAKISSDYQTYMWEHLDIAPSYSSSNTSDMNLAITAAEMYDCFSFWTDVDTNRFMALFSSRVDSKYQLALISGYFQYVFNTDLWTLMNNGLKFFGFLGSSGGIGSGNVSQIVDMVKNLPD